MTQETAPLTRKREIRMTTNYTTTTPKKSVPSFTAFLRFLEITDTELADPENQKKVLDYVEGRIAAHLKNKTKANQMPADFTTEVETLLPEVLRKLGGSGRLYNVAGGYEFGSKLGNKYNGAQLEAWLFQFAECFRAKYTTTTKGPIRSIALVGEHQRDVQIGGAVGIPDGAPRLTDVIQGAM